MLTWDFEGGGGENWEFLMSVAADRTSPRCENTTVCNKLPFKEEETWTDKKERSGKKITCSDWMPFWHPTCETAYDNDKVTPPSFFLKSNTSSVSAWEQERRQSFQFGGEELNKEYTLCVWIQYDTQDIQQLHFFWPIAIQNFLEGSKTISTYSIKRKDWITVTKWDAVWKTEHFLQSLALISFENDFTEVITAEILHLHASSHSESTKASTFLVQHLTKKFNQRRSSMTHDSSFRCKLHRQKTNSHAGSVNILSEWTYTCIMMEKVVKVWNSFLFRSEMASSFVRCLLQITFCINTSTAVFFCRCFVPSRLTQQWTHLYL